MAPRIRLLVFLRWLAQHVHVLHFVEQHVCQQRLARREERIDLDHDTRRFTVSSSRTCPGRSSVVSALSAQSRGTGSYAYAVAQSRANAA